MDLFPAPAIPKHPREPKPLPGATIESTTTLQRVLHQNRSRFHVLFNDAPLHNHISHHVIALWWLGASPERIQEAFDLETGDQRPVDTGVTPEVVSITAENFLDHLGDHKFYQSYLMFFEKAVEELGIAGAFEKYVLAPEYNSRGGMLNCLFEGVVHPLIHIGHAMEFDLPGMLSEGLALAAITGARSRDDLLPSFVTESASAIRAQAAQASGITQKLASLSFLPGTRNTGDVPRCPTTPHALTFIPRIDADDDCAIPMAAFFDEEFSKKFRPKVQAFVDEWITDAIAGCDEAGLQELLWRKVDELIWLCCVIYAIGGVNSKAKEAGDKEGLRFNDDFFTMHLVTSVVFLPSYIQKLHSHPKSAVAFLQSYFVNTLLWYIARRDNTPLNVKNFYQETEALHAHPKLKGTGNPWTPIIEASIEHEDEHLPKLQRALLHFAATYGTQVSKDIFDFHGVTLDPNIKLFERLDGTLFWRAAAATLVRFPAAGGKKGAPILSRVTEAWDGLDSLIDPTKLSVSNYTVDGPGGSQEVS